MHRGPVAAAVALLSLAASGCGKDEADRRFSLTTPKPPDGVVETVLDPGATPVPTPKPRKGELKPTSATARRLGRGVLTDWADAVRRNDVKAASKLFAVPAIVEQPSTPGGVSLLSQAQVEAFNDALPCGATFEDAQQNGRFVVGTFRLTPRPQRTCAAEGQLVRVAFVVRGGRFVEFRQLPDRPGAQPQPTEPKPAPPAGSGEL